MSTPKDDDNPTICKHCGVEIEPTWEHVRWVWYRSDRRSWSNNDQAFCVRTGKERGHEPLRYGDVT